MDLFALRNNIINDYSTYIQSFIEIRDQRIHDKVKAELGSGMLWLDPLIQLNPAFAWGGSVDDLVDGDTVYATPEPKQTRSITLQGQQYAPNRESRTGLLCVPEISSGLSKRSSRDQGKQ